MVSTIAHTEAPASDASTNALPGSKRGLPLGVVQSGAARCPKPIWLMTCTARVPRQILPGTRRIRPPGPPTWNWPQPIIVWSSGPSSGLRFPSSIPAAACVRTPAPLASLNAATSAGPCRSPPAVRSAPRWPFTSPHRPRHLQARAGRCARQRAPARSPGSSAFAGWRPTRGD